MKKMYQLHRGQKKKILLINQKINIKKERSPFKILIKILYHLKRQKKRFLKNKNIFK